MKLLTKLRRQNEKKAKKEDKSVLYLDTKEKSISFQVDGKEQIGHYTWFRGENTNFNPALDNMRDETAVIRHILKGWAPERPLIGPDTKVTAIGSCFAYNISKWLAERNFSVLTDKNKADEIDAYIIRFGEGMVNTFVIRQQFEWALEGKTFGEELWHGYKAEAYGYDESIRENTKAIFDKTDIFILTLGLSEIWYDEVTGGVFWRAVPQDKYDPSRHKFRVSSVSENKDNIRAIYDLIRKHRPDAKIIFTLSPIPLVATFRDASCITANAVSKAVLRSALDEFLRDVMDEGHAYYWPSYEIVLEAFADRWKPDRRHVKDEILHYIMSLFEQTWCHGTTPRYTILEAWLRALSATGALPEQTSKALAGKDIKTLKRIKDTLAREEGKHIEIDMLERFIQECAQH